MPQTTYLDKLLGKIINAMGVPQPARSALNFTGTGVSVTDDSTNDQTTITINSGGTTYTLDTGSGALAAGNVVQLKPGSTSPTLITKFVSPFQGGTLGVVTAAHTPGDTNVIVAQDGSVLPNSVTGLGASTDSEPHNVIATSSGGLAYSYFPDGSEYIIGHSPGDGRLFVGQRSPNGTAPLHTFNPKAPPFNCPWDGVHDDRPGFLAMLAALPVTGAVVDLPPGPGYFSDNVRNTKQVHFRGRFGGTDYASSKLGTSFVFPAGKGFYNDAAAISSDGNVASYSKFEHISFISQLLIQGTQYYQLSNGRAASTYYPLGYVVRAYSVSNTTCFFRVTTAGTTSSGGEPSGFSATTSGTTITDGGVTWTAENYPKDRLNSHSYSVGDRIFVVGDCRYWFECTVAGMSDSSLPAGFGFPSYDADHTSQTVVETSGLTWRVHSHAGVVDTTVQTIYQDCFFLGFTGPAYYFLSSASPALFSDFSSIRGGNAAYCGMGICIAGFDSNAIVVDRFSTIFMGIGRTILDSTHGAGGYTVWDRGLSNTFIGLYSQDGAGPAYFNDGASSGVYLHCGSENAYPSIAASLGLSIGTSQAGVTTTGGFGDWVTIEARGCQNLAGLGPNGGSVALATGASTDYFLGISPNGDSGTTAYWDQAVNGSSIGSDWVAQAYGPFNGNTGTRPYVGFSRFSARNTSGGSGPGFHFRIYRGYFTGRSADKYVAVDDGELTAASLRYGSRVVGDLFPWTSATHAVGTWRKVTCTSAGVRGVPWTSGLTYRAEVGPPYYTEATIVEPSTSNTLFSTGLTRAWKFISGPGNSGTEPIWPSSGGFTDAAGNVWADAGLTAKFGANDFVDDPVTSLTPQSQMAWKDTAATDAATAAPKAYVLSYRAQFQTTMSTANQTLFTVPDFPDNSSCDVSVVIGAKRNGNHSSYLKARISASRGRNNGGAPEDGTDIVTTETYGSENALSGITCDLHDSGNGALVRVNNPTATTIDWGIEVQVAVRVS